MKLESQCGVFVKAVADLLDDRVDGARQIVVIAHLDDLGVRLVQAVGLLGVAGHFSEPALKRFDL
ncbi:MAG: hypothetical protein HY075_00185 [Deltaproteobacteria bacterium]|nr:hypothetical protein [Deltaproteobacteria bacterium]